MALIYQISNEIENILLMNLGQGEKFQPFDEDYSQFFDTLRTFWSSLIENHSFFKDEDDLDGVNRSRVCAKISELLSSCEMSLLILKTWSTN